MSSGFIPINDIDFEKRLADIKEEIMNLIRGIQLELEKRINFDDLWKSEALILEKLDEVAGALLKKLADKGDTKKALLYLERKVSLAM